MSAHPSGACARPSARLAAVRRQAREFVEKKHNSRDGYYVRMLVRRTVAVALALLEVGLAALTVWGMATGAHIQRENGQTTAGVVAAVLGLGAACLVVLGVALVRAVRLWRSRRYGAVAWFAVALLVWLAWAFTRVIEDSS